MQRGFENGSIVLDSKTETYYPGQVVSGTLNFTIDSILTFHGIAVRFVGEADVFWEETETESYDGQTRTYSVPYRGHEDYFNFIQYVSGGQPAMTTLTPGTYTYPIHYQIPFVCPSSFEGERGSVTYSIRASLEQGPGMPFNPPQEFSKVFNVVAPLDLNADSRAKEPIEFDFEEVYSCCLCESGVLSISFRAPASGYCPGQHIPMAIEADNQSNVEVQKIALYLKKREAYHSQEPRSDYEMETETISSIKKGPVPCGTHRNYTAQIEIPAIIVPNMANCSLIDVDYFIEVEVKVSGACNDDSQDETDILLGSIPLVGIQDTNYVHPMKDSLPEHPPPDPRLCQTLPLTQNYPVNPPYPAQGYPEVQGVASQNQSYPGQIGFTVPVEVVGNGNAPYPASTAPYPGSNPPYPRSNPSYSAANPPYPGGDPSYPEKNAGYPAANPIPAYPTSTLSTPAYPASNPPYPTPNLSYPPSTGSNPPYPGSNQSYPMSNSYPGSTPGQPQAPPYSAQAPEPSAPSAPQL